MSETNLNTLIICTAIVLTVALILFSNRHRTKLVFWIKARFKVGTFEVKVDTEDKPPEKVSKKRKDAFPEAPIQ